ncbi:hypothetical protein P154DRAFT_524525 [Amniculicola lignicola CBS 123094]|uniref:Uncharacterized protein n=1 Tax=Amniculicola lignicola CBS 123094 TaxID=1392246 RepID=A0A6A5W765_9PLEO|nr:hypothetical protein P154DRAFT_524525 [Amniculicola lignicola CBS 123094]
MAVCKFEGNSDMYGLGIRLGYYFQWYGAIFAAWLAPSEVRGLRFTIDAFVSASFLALIILTAGDIKSLEPAETYIVLLLMFGAYLALIPIYIWRILTACDPYWDPSRYPLVRYSALSANLSFILLIGVLVYQYWFWFNRVPDLNQYNCQQYGFVLGQVRLNSKASVVLNALMYFMIGLICLYLLLLKVRAIAGRPDPMERRKKRKMSRRHLATHIELLRNMDTWFKIVVALAVTVATELTISWNEIKGVNNLSSAGQTIPFIIGLFALIRIFYVYLFKSDENSGSEYSYYADSDPLLDRDLPPRMGEVRHRGGGPTRPMAARVGGRGIRHPLPDSRLPRPAYLTRDLHR